MVISMLVSLCSWTPRSPPGPGPTRWSRRRDGGAGVPRRAVRDRASAVRGGRAPSEIARPLFAAAALHTSSTDDYYGQIPWTARFSWWSAW